MGGWQTKGGGTLAAGEEGQTKSSRRRAADGGKLVKSGWRRTAGEEWHVEGSRRTAADEDRQTGAAADIVGNGYREAGERGVPSGRPAFV